MREYWLYFVYFILSGSAAPLRSRRTILDLLASWGALRAFGSWALRPLKWCVELLQRATQRFRSRIRRLSEKVILRRLVLKSECLGVRQVTFCDFLNGRLAPNPCQCHTCELRPRVIHWDGGFGAASDCQIPIPDPTPSESPVRRLGRAVLTFEAFDFASTKAPVR